MGRDIGERNESQIIDMDLFKGNENKKLVEKSLRFLSNYIFIGII